MRYLLGKIGVFLVTLWAAITLNFALPRLMPGSPVDCGAGQDRLDRPADHQPAEARDRAATRRAARQRVQPVLPVPRQHLPARLRPVLLVPERDRRAHHRQGAALDAGAGRLHHHPRLRDRHPARGVRRLAARQPSTDTTVTVGATLFAAFPPFWLGLLLLFFTAFKHRWFPISGGYSPGLSPQWSWYFLTDAIPHAVLPAFVLAITSLSGWVFGMRNNMINTLGEDYVTFAEANGLRGRTIALRYAARNALLPNVTAFGLSLGAVIGGSVLVEGVFGYPGLGQPALHRRHQPRLPADAGGIPRHHGEHAGGDLHRRHALRPTRSEGAPMTIVTSTPPPATGPAPRRRSPPLPPAPGPGPVPAAIAGHPLAQRQGPDRPDHPGGQRAGRAVRPAAGAALTQVDRLPPVQRADRHELVRHHRRRPGRVQPVPVRRPGFAAGRPGRRPGRHRGRRGRSA